MSSLSIRTLDTLTLRNNKVFKNGPSEIRGKQSSKNLK